MKNTISGIELSHADRILKITGNVTKLQLAAYYDTIKEFILPYVINRPLVMYRCPEDEKCFFQKHPAKYFPKELYRVLIKENQSHKKKEYIYIKDIKGLIALVQFSTLEIHPWASYTNNVEKPDFITLDLDPDPKIAWKLVIKAALQLKNMLEEVSLKSFVKTSGGKGLHVVIPFRRGPNWLEVKEFSHQIALYLIQDYPKLYTDNPLKAKRKGKIFIDYLRNGRGATSVSAYSMRAKKNGPISTPVSWPELTRVKSSDQFNIFNIVNRLHKLKSDPWDDFLHCKQSLPKIN